MWPDPAQNAANTRWVKEYYRDLAPHAEEGGYINMVSGDDASRVQANFGRSYARLRKIKAKYDPKNAFRHNQNIVPT